MPPFILHFMYDITNLNKDGDINKDYILSKINEYSIYVYYIGSKFRIGDCFPSPLRDTDNHPSFGIFKGRSGTLMFKDMSTGESGDCFKFVQLLLNKKDYRSALLEVYTNLVINSAKIPIKKYEPVEKPRTDLGITRGKFAQYDLDYWLQYNITEYILKKFDVYKTYKVFNGDKLLWTHNKMNPIYTYKIFNNFKMYRPKAKKGNKWLANITLFDIGGYKQLPEKGEILIISKAMKDVMFLYSIGIPAICPSSETAPIPESIITNLKKRFKKIIIWFDNDKPGIMAAKKMGMLYDLSYAYIPIIYDEKDLTDFIVVHGLLETKKLIKNEMRRMDIIL